MDLNEPVRCENSDCINEDCQIIPQIEMKNYETFFVTIPLIDWVKYLVPKFINQMNFDHHHDSENLHDITCGTEYERLKRLASAETYSIITITLAFDGAPYTKDKKNQFGLCLGL